MERNIKIIRNTTTMDSLNEFSLVLLHERQDAREILDTIKRMLMSRNLDLQMKAVLYVVNSLSMCSSIENGSGLNKESLPDFLLNSDLTEFLCEAMSTVHCHLIDEILKCLEMLSKNNKFYRNSHVVFVTECVVRTVHFLKRQDTSCITLNRALALLAAILNGYDDMQISALNISPVLEMLKTILEDKVEMGGGTALQATAVLNSIMENRLVASQFDMRLLEWLSTILEGSMSQLSKLAMPNNKDAMLLMIGVSASTSRLCASLWFVNVEAAMIEKYTRKIARILLECIQDVCVPFILDTYIEDTNFDLFFKFFSSLKVIYEEQMKSLDIIQLSCYLGEQGFLTLIPVISSWSSRRNCNQLHYVCMSLLGELLVSMSESVLDASQLWPGGTKAFREHLIVGLWHLPSDYTDWLNLLGATHATEPSQHTIIVLSFFSCACASSPNVTAPFLPAVVAYLTSIQSASFVPTLIAKALWFVFAASSLSYRGSIDLGHATNMLLRLLELQIDVRNVYIHHPALLHWAFSNTVITSTLQGLLMNLWLEVEDDDVMLMDLITINQDAKFCLIDVVQCGTAVVGRRALKVLESLLLQQLQNGKEDLLYTLWEVMPHILARFSAGYSHTQTAGNVAGLLQLASISVPQQISSTAVVRASCLLAQVLMNKTDASLEFYKSALYQASLLLLVSMELQDKRVLGIFVSEPKFLQMLQTFMNPEYPEVCSSALHLLFLLLYYQMQLPFLECEYSVVVDGNKILELLTNSDLNVQSVCLQLTCHLLLSRLQKPVIRLIGGSSSEFVRAFFIQLQILCTKKIYEVSSRAWKCMGILLQTCEDPLLKMHLASQPWTGFIVSITVQNISSPCTLNFLYFVDQWLQALQAFNPLSKRKYARIACKKERALAPHSLCEPLSELATMVLNDLNLSAASPAMKELVLQVMNGILDSGVDLNDKLQCCLKLQVQQLQAP